MDDETDVLSPSGGAGPQERHEMMGFLEFLFRLIGVVLTLFIVTVVLAAVCYILTFGFLWRLMFG